MMLMDGLTEAPLFLLPGVLQGLDSLVSALPAEQSPRGTGCVANVQPLQTKLPLLEMQRALNRVPKMLPLQQQPRHFRCSRVQKQRVKGGKYQIGLVPLIRPCLNTICAQPVLQ